MFNSIKRLAASLLIAVLLVGSLSVTSAEAALAKPANARFVRWNNKQFTSCRIGWNKVKNADGYEIKWTYTDRSHYKHTYQYYIYNVLDINGLSSENVYQVQVRAIKLNANNKPSGYSPWSNYVFITPWPRNLSGRLSGSHNVKIKWNKISGSSGYNILLTTNPYGSWRWNQYTAEKASATSCKIKKYQKSKLKKYTNYYIRVMTRLKRNGHYLSTPAPGSGYYSGTFYIYKTYTAN